MKTRIAIGIDMGGTNTAFGLVDEHGKILAKDNVPTTAFSTPEALAAEVSSRAKKLIGTGYELLGIGIGAPCGNFFTGHIEFAPNLPWKGIIPLADYFSSQLNCRTVLTNDAKAAALGELFFGGAKAMKDFIFITLGTGLGSGIVVNGRLVYGHDGMAGEMGHVIMVEEGRQCGCGRRGCLETYCSATGIRRTYSELLTGRQAAVEEKMPDAKHIYDKARTGDALALEAFRQTGEMLGLALANSVTYTSPEAIFLFGGLAQAGELIFKPTRESFKKNLLNVYRREIKIIPSLLKENDAAVLGAASLAWNEWRNKK